MVQGDTIVFQKEGKFEICEWVDLLVLFGGFCFGFGGFICLFLFGGEFFWCCFGFFYKYLL